jgi:hypothetical protein
MPAGGPGLLAQVGTWVRTRRDAEALRDEILRGGYEKEVLLTLYRAILALLGDMAALMYLPEPQHTVAMEVYRKLKGQYIGGSECRCLRNATGGVAVPMTTCPVHGQTPGARVGMRNFGGLKR